MTPKNIETKLPLLYYVIIGNTKTLSDIYEKIFVYIIIRVLLSHQTHLQIASDMWFPEIISRQKQQQKKRNACASPDNERGEMSQPCCMKDVSENQNAL